MEPKYVVFIGGSIGFLFGIWIRNFFAYITGTVSLLVLLFCFLVFIALLWASKKGAFACYIGGMCFFVGYIFCAFTWKQVEKKEVFLRAYEHTQTFSLYVVDEEKTTHQESVYRVRLLDIQKQVGKVDGYLYVPAYVSFVPWEYITVKKGKILPLKDVSSLFSYRFFLFSRGVYFQVRFPETIEKKKQEASIFTYRYEYKKKLLERIFRIFPLEEAVLFAWIMIGADHNIPSRMKEAFQKTWLTHLMVVSGFNITIIILFLWFLFQYVPMTARWGMIGVSVVLYTFFVWWTVPVVRAWIMGLLSYSLLVFGRKWDFLAITLMTLVCIVCFSPLSLNYDISLHLSFFALLGIVYFQDFWKRVLYFVPSFFALKESLVATFCAMTATFPFMVFQFQTISLVAPVANMLVGSVIPLAMLLGTMTLLVDFISPFVSYIVWFVAFYPLHWVVQVAYAFSSFSFSTVSFDIGPYGMYLEAFVFWLLFFLIVLLEEKRRK